MPIDEITRVRARREVRALREAGKDPLTKDHTLKVIKAITPAVGWSAVFWNHNLDLEPPVELSWEPVVVWAICTFDYDGEEEDQVRAMITGVGGGLSPVEDSADASPLEGPYCLGLYPTAQQVDPTLTATLIAWAKSEAPHQLRRREEMWERLDEYDATEPAT